MRFPSVLALLLLLPAARQDPPIGIIDFYGLHRVTAAQIRQALPFKEGDLLSVPSDEVKARVEKVPGVVRASISGVCCDSGKVILYVGVEEAGAASLRFRPAPRSMLRLPPDVVDAYSAFEKALDDAVRSGQSTEEAPKGHSLMRDPAARAIQERFVAFANRDLARLRDVLRNSAYEDQRAIAALVLPYADDKRAIVGDLVDAVRDPAEEVRNNAVRGLWVMAAYAQRTPESGLAIPWEPFVDLLNSPEWTDRNKSSLALMELSERRDPALLRALRERALDALVEMAGWKSQGHALAAFWIVGRVAGLPENELRAAWARGDHDSVIRAVRAGQKVQ
jgi:hypothetical protein